MPHLIKLLHHATPYQITPSCHTLSNYSIMPHLIKLLHHATHQITPSCHTLSNYSIMPHLIKGFRNIKKNCARFIVFFKIFVNSRSDRKKLVNCRISRSETGLITRIQIIFVKGSVNLVKYNFL